ncbi:16S rRNA (guanine(966)-N(2))-methyltransferase RsmD [Mycoplasma zalophidermidis]|uniref:16S rRNA (guanine(966)-N(2))-methyltransferase RsmD n=1 Tax=Mycoplasma zalophidermidis TaxID=398174 RepID=UPI00215C5F6C|nr:16S rRNA (guanine(966)-N(2))-methyltransferase RsmD [Mycoplasma zalophidermidis]MCR8966276.1 16S rRNA (guanine(966)-N(2))-methyltransferase RsmD [Mycoplasma zalophidermidis]
MLRIISGKYRRLLIQQPKTELTRPTKDSIREAIFNSLRFELEGTLILDLFAGSGAMGIESLSNNAMKAYFVDINKEAIQTINTNLDNLKIHNAEVFKMSATEFLKTKTGRNFDFIFIDPPYQEYDLLNQCLELISTNKFLNDLGYLVIETDDINRIVIPEKMLIQKTKQYGKTTILFVSNNI